MNHQIPELDNIRLQLMIEKPKKQKILVVDDEQDNLDLLYRTFRRDFHVLKADSGVNALQLLATEGEVAVIISDQRMPEMKGTEFLSKTVSQFPDTVRIILTGFTDIEDLVEAINAGQVYKYLTKPWDPDELKAVVQQATQTYDLLKQRTAELRRATAQMDLLNVLVQLIQQSASLEIFLNSIAKTFGKSFAADSCTLQLVEGNALVAQQGIYTTSIDQLDHAPFTNEAMIALKDAALQAITTQKIQISANVPDQKLTSIAHNDLSTKSPTYYMAIPITYQNTVLAVLSLQWKQPCTLGEDKLQLIHLSSQLVAILLTCTRYRQPTK